MEGGNTEEPTRNPSRCCTISYPFLFLLMLLVLLPVCICILRVCVFVFIFCVFMGLLLLIYSAAPVVSSFYVSLYARTPFTSLHPVSLYLPLPLSLYRLPPLALLYLHILLLRRFLADHGQVHMCGNGDCGQVRNRPQFYFLFFSVCVCVIIIHSTWRL